MRKTVIAFALSLGLPLSASAAEICDQIATVAAGWTELGTLIHETQADGFTDEESSKIGEAIGSLSGGTAALADALQAGGNAGQVALGDALEAHLTKLAELEDDAEDEYLASILDDVGATMETVGHDCAAHSE